MVGHCSVQGDAISQQAYLAPDHHYKEASLCDVVGGQICVVCKHLHTHKGKCPVNFAKPQCPRTYFTWGLHDRRRGYS